MTDNRQLPAEYNAPVPASPGGWGGAAEYDEETEGQKGPGLKRYVAALYRHKWVILACTVVGGAVGAFASRQVTLKYVAEATFWFDGGSTGGLPGPIQGTGLLPTGAWIELLRSYTVLDHVVREHRLYLEHHPKDAAALSGFQLDSLFRAGDFTFRASDDGRTADLRTKEGILVETVARGSAAGREIGFLWTPPDEAFMPKRTIRFSVLTPREAARQMNGSLTTRFPTGNFLAIGFTGNDPEKVAAVVNAVGARFMEVAAELKRGKMTELREILESQLDFARRNLEAAEMALEGFRVQTITLPTDAAAPVSAAGLQTTTGPALAAYFDLKIRRDNLDLDIQAIERALRSSGRDTISVDALSAVGAVQASPELSGALANLVSERAALRALLQQYTPEHPAVLRAREQLTDLEQRIIPGLASALVNELNNRGQVLDQLIASTSGELREIPPRTIEEARLRRAVTIAEELHNELHQRMETTRLAAEATMPDLRVLDRATAPTRPSGDPRLQMILMGIAVAFGIGVGLAILMDRADPRLRYAEQVTHELGLTIVGAVPSLRAARKGLMNPTDQSKMTEALRAVRLSMTHAYGAVRPMIVTITSPGSGDGKTFISSNLALTFADLGMRTLVIDGDTRRGQLHRLYSVERRPGLTDYLAGNATLESVIRRTQYDLVDALPLGSRRQDSPELLSTPRMGELLAGIKSKYQVILIDSPPLGAGVDPLVLATLSGSLVMVMRTGRTDRALAEAKLQMLERLPVRVLGVILNGFDTIDAYNYYSYLPGYEANEEDSTEMLLPAQAAAL